jgi:hypothetical protein
MNRFRTRFEVKLDSLDRSATAGSKNTLKIYD